MDGTTVGTLDGTIDGTIVGSIDGTLDGIVLGDFVGCTIRPVVCSKIYKTNSTNEYEIVDQ